MALYTELNQKQIIEIAASFGLPAPKSFEGVLEGTVNTYYRLKYPKGVYYLKIDEIGDLPRLKKELFILNLLSGLEKETGFKTPIPLKASRNDCFVPFKKKYALIFPEISGKSLPLAKITPNALKIIGRAMARMHLATKRSLIKPHRFYFPELAKVYQTIRPKLKAKHPDLFVEMEKKMQWAMVNQLKTVPSGLVHADLFPENILFSGSKLSGFLDFEAAGRGPFLFDLCVVIHACCHDGKKFNMQRIKNFLSGYESTRKLTTLEQNYFSFFLYESALRFLVTRLRDFELKNEPVKAKPFKDYREYVKRFDEIPELITALNLPKPPPLEV